MMAALNLPHLLLLLLLLLRPSHSAGPCASPSAADVAACQAEGEAALGPYTPQSWEPPVCGVVARMAARYDDLSREEWTECVSFVSALDTARSPRLRALQLSMLRSHVAKLALWHQRERDEMYSLILKQQSTLVSAANLATRQQNFAEKQLLLVEEQLALLHQLRARVLELEAQQRAAAAASFPAPAGGAALQRSWQDACLTAAGALAFFYAVRLAKQRLFGP
jgi:hypothetical protein